MEDVHPDRWHAGGQLSPLPEEIQQPESPSLPAASKSPMVRKKALLIGIRNSATPGYEELEASHSDVSAMRDMLLDMWGYTESQITVLVDDNVEGHVQPTRVNILRAIANFVKDVKEGDHLLFHYAGHSTQIDNPRSNSEEDGKDECLVPMDGEHNKIVDNELHACLIKPLPAGSHLVAILDTCHAGSLLDLKHYRCNRVPVPWIWRGNRNSEDIRNNVERRGARMVTVSQPVDPTLHTDNNPPTSTHPQRSVLSVMTPAPSPSSSRTPTAISPPSSRTPTATSMSPPPPSRTPTAASTAPSRTPTGLSYPGSGVARGPLARIRTNLKLRTRSVSVSQADKENTEGVAHLPSALPKESRILSDEDRYYQSPVALFPCDGWCRNAETHSTTISEDDEVKADVISLASCRDSQQAWEGANGLSVSSLFVAMMRENPNRTWKEVMIRVSHAAYSLALVRHANSKEFKRKRKKYVSSLGPRIARLERRNQSPGALRDLAVRMFFDAKARAVKSTASRFIHKHVASLKRQVKEDVGKFDRDNFQNPELASPRPLDMGRAVVL
ncbi:caspase domain-containing protein [Mycena metata]|uniref:Caspase domain-containing protein n=1 Tax=Mycena metata TaxID=1033252 RepID=A0AAD7JG46_9AGAR|nr:caspase domain-containing protein [Mycena metata]